MIDRIRADVEVASGREPADIVFRDGRFLDVFTGDLFHGDMAVRDGRVVALGSYRGRKEIDLGGKIVVPGLIDAHVHIESSLLAPPGFAALTVPRGTTTVIADPHEIANVRGIEGIRWLLEASEGVPQTVFVMLPSCVPATPFEDSGAILETEDLAPLMGHPRVLGLGEAMDYPAVAAGRDGILGKIALAREVGKRVDGHSPMMRGRDLAAYAAAGVSTDHECSTLDEMKERLRLGMRILIREGTAARDLAALIQGVDPGIARRCAFCTDDKLPGDILEEGQIDYNIRLAVAEGLSPVDAIRMATLNAAEAFGLDDRGAFGPGRVADLVVLEGSLEEFRVDRVFRGGAAVAAGGKLLNELPEPDHAAVLDTVRLAPLGPDDLALKLPSGRARVITLSAGSLVTGNETREVPIDDNGYFVAEKGTDILKLAVIERHRALDRRGVGLVTGYGLSGGAAASSIAHDSHNIIVVGDDDRAMIAAIRAVASGGGGIAVSVTGGEVIGVLPLPLGGLMTDAQGEETAGRLDDLIALARERLGVSGDIDPFMPLSFLALPVIPELKLTARGLFDVARFEFVGVEVA